MRVFISWSGEESRALASHLRGWIKIVLQTIDPWMSDKDIASGSRWSVAISEKLKESKVGTICVTPENVAAPWLHFEAGALSKTVDDAFVCPLLFHAEPADLKGPMSQFQAQRFGRAGVLSVMETIRSHPDNNSTLSDAEFVDSFESSWPRLDESVQKVLATHKSHKARSEGELMMAETLELVRGIARDVRLAAGRPIPTRIDDLRDHATAGPVPTGVNDKVRSLPADTLVRMLTEWDATLPTLLGGNQQLKRLVELILRNEVGQATSQAMQMTGYKLPEARAFIGSLTIGMTRLAE